MFLSRPDFFRRGVTYANLNLSGKEPWNIDRLTRLDHRWSVEWRSTTLVVRWTRCSPPGLNDYTALWGQSEHSTWRLNLLSSDYLRGPLQPILRALNWATITNYDNDSCNSCNGIYVNININEILLYHCYSVVTWSEPATWGLGRMYNCTLFFSTWYI